MPGPLATQMAMPIYVAPQAPATPTSDRSAWQRAMLTSGLRPATKLVALAVSVHSAPPTPATTGIATCAPGLAALVAEVGYSRAHVLRQMRLLRDHGWLATVGRPAPGRSTVYGLMLPATASPSPRPARIVAPAAARGTRHRASRARIPASAMDTLASPRPRAAGLVDLLDGRACLPTRAQTSAAVVPPAPPAPPAPPVPPRQTPIPGTSGPAAVQVLAALARALRCEPATLEDLGEAMRGILDEGAWPAVELAAHLADGIARSVDDPYALVARRLARLPETPTACGCRPCASLVAARRPTRPAPAPTPAPVTDPAPNTARPDLASIERAAAAGTAQARQRRRAAPDTTAAGSGSARRPT